MAETIIRVANLNKQYKNFTAVENLSFDVEKGSLFAFLGPNGAGKSTTINMLTTALVPSNGTIEIAGELVGKGNQKIREKIGIVFQENVLDNLLTIKENLYLWGENYGLTKAEIKTRLKFYNDKMDLHSILSKRFGQLSGGQKRRAEIAREIIHQPEILFLDEPTTGLDPETRQHVWQLIDYLQNELHMTVFLTTHYMEEAANADNIMVIQNGKIVASGTPIQIKHQYAKDTLVLYEVTDSIDVIDYLKKQGLSYQMDRQNIQISIENDQLVLSLLNQLKTYYHHFEFQKGNLDQAFVNIIQGGESK